MKLDLKKDNLNLEKNYSYINYLMLITEIYIFIFRFKLDPDIHEKGLSFLGGSKIMSDLLTNSMRFKQPLSNNLSQDWIDFPLINDIFIRYKYIWVKNNVFKNSKVDSFKNKLSEKYDYIVEKIIVDKDKKNLFQNEMCLLCFRDNKGGFEYIIPLIQIIPFSIMCILNKLKNTKNEKEFLFWLKDLKCFIRFIIIGSCNLNKSNQNGYYTSLLL